MMPAFIGAVFLFLWVVVGLAILGGLAYGLYWIVSRWNDDGRDAVDDPDEIVDDTI